MTSALHPVRHTLHTPEATGREPLVIGLVNNMPDAALQSTERQFAELLAAAGAAYEIRLRLFSFPELIRSEAGRTYVATHYESIDQLWNGEFDGLIVTGAEPRTAVLSDEVYWPSLTRLVDLATHTGTPTIWSCLAAHAAVLYLDGVERSPLDRKISGVFCCARTSDDPLLAGMPASWRIPHSRHNTLDSHRLRSAGYEILSWSEEAGADTFILRKQAAFVFYQGHPEYDAAALFREYRRDVGRFLQGTQECYPELPCWYFDDVAARAFSEFRALAHRKRSRDLLERFPGGGAQERVVHGWRDDAIRLYANWLRGFVSHAASAENRQAASTIAARAHR